MEVRGEWFLPTDDSCKLRGTLQHDDVEGTILEVEGNFSRSIPFFNDGIETAAIILGESTEGYRVTLVDCFVFNAIIDTKKGHVERWRVNRAFTDIHVATEEELTFTSVDTQINPLYAWLDKKNEENNSFELTDELIIKYTLPKSISFPIRENITGEFSFSTSPRFDSKNPQQDLIAHAAYFKIKAAAGSEVHYKEFDLLVKRFTDFLKIATGFPCELTEKKYYHKTKYIRQEFPDGSSLPLAVNRLHRRRKEQLDNWHPTDYFFTYPVVENFAPDLFTRWYQLYDSIAVVLQILAERIVKQREFTEFHFKDVVQALEAFHRKLINNERMPKADFEQLKERILQQISDDGDRDFAKNRFNTGNEPSLKERVNNLIDSCNLPQVLAAIGDKEQFVKLVVENRNYLTHLDKTNKKNILEGAELYFLTRKCLFLLYAVVLKKLFDNDVFVNALLERSCSYGNKFSNLLPSQH